MAELILRPATSTTQFGCYSERGLMSYFMFVVLPTQVGDFLASLQFPEGIPSPFTHWSGTHPRATIFSELNFGNEGFGCPDGAVFVEAPAPAMLILETKLNESFVQSCGGASYNSTIRGQLELRWRMTELHRTKSHQVYKGTTYIQETAEFKAIYKVADNAFYGHEDRQDEAWPGSWRRLRITEGVKAFLDLLTRCEDRVYFCAITKDEQNPLDSVDASLLPRCGGIDWPATKHHFCWLPVTQILKATPRKDQEVATHVNSCNPSTQSFQVETEWISIMDWLYRFTSNDDYPDPVEEIDFLCTLDGNDESTFLMLATGNSPPLSRASTGEVVGLCTSQGNRLILHGTAVVAGESIRGNTPPSVQSIYGNLTERAFCPLKDLERLPSQDLPEATLSHADQETFLKGQSFVKRLTPGTRAARKPAARGPARTDSPESVPSFPKMVCPQKFPAFTVVGLDPTAGTWGSKMAEGPKKMPSFALRWDGEGFTPDDDPLVFHSTNVDFWAEVGRRRAAMTCIDGPCGTNGPRLVAELTGWDLNGLKGARGGELTLSHQGVNLFWTTQNTVIKFDGASRWIARSLVLFSEALNQRKIETHPHGAFTFLWRLFGGVGAPPKKSRPSGRGARLSLLRSFIPDLSDGMVPNHDAVDAACAALIAGLHQLRLTTPFGTSSNGGQIWMPDCEQLVAFLPRSPEAEDV